MTKRDLSAATQRIDESVDRVVRKLLVGLGAIMVVGFSLTLLALAIGTWIIIAQVK